MATKTHGRCHVCRPDPGFKAVVYRWRGKPLLREARCPRCATVLARTALNLMSNANVRNEIPRHIYDFEGAIEC